VSYGCGQPLFSATLSTLGNCGFCATSEEWCPVTGVVKPYTVELLSGLRGTAMHSWDNDGYIL
jgi:hypothetical protein